MRRSPRPTRTDPLFPYPTLFRSTLEDPRARLDAAANIRSLVGKIVLHPGEKRGEVHATLHGSLMGILDFVNDNPVPSTDRVITKVCPGSREWRREGRVRPSPQVSETSGLTLPASCLRPCVVEARSEEHTSELQSLMRL